METRVSESSKARQQELTIPFSVVLWSAVCRQCDAHSERRHVLQHDRYQSVLERLGPTRVLLHTMQEGGRCWVGFISPVARALLTTTCRYCSFMLGNELQMGLGTGVGSSCWFSIAILLEFQSLPGRRTHLPPSGFKAT